MLGSSGRATGVLVLGGSGGLGLELVVVQVWGIHGGRQCSFRVVMRVNTKAVQSLTWCHPKTGVVVDTHRRVGGWMVMSTEEVVKSMSRFDGHSSIAGG